eukprot:CAMPEP_0183314540 /NCGR_PEP_ID=MMETSP0160_2-20130417/48785_1 /TAXON_ID=2839 ORGANISM="Odontella Sinensis, Strain Grunow 1884" /NCGR_SAMPLE_ID=MMETSP0160_2 /ASSEMBLY_ACC=CAM_ASM_000250 /LENGTH=152 /DNA_ID=CAMNT_0025479895 /DNA_START=460 /DNA_END=918 /DNA_ORIENTATION=-
MAPVRKNIRHAPRVSGHVGAQHGDPGAPHALVGPYQMEDAPVVAAGASKPAKSGEEEPPPGRSVVEHRGAREEVIEHAVREARLGHARRQPRRVPRLHQGLEVEELLPKAKPDGFVEAVLLHGGVVDARAASKGGVLDRVSADFPRLIVYWL